MSFKTFLWLNVCVLLWVITVVHLILESQD